MILRFWWKTYFLIATCLTAIGLIEPFAFPEEMAMTWLDYSFLPVHIMQNIALFGYVYERSIASANVWKLVFLVTVPHELWNAYQLTAALEFDPPTSLLVVLVVVYLLQIPMWIGIYRYGFRCNKLWQRTVAEETV